MDTWLVYGSRYQTNQPIANYSESDITDMQSAHSGRDRHNRTDGATIHDPRFSFERNGLHASPVGKNHRS
jgi:hypothetical protein